jgi:hypothetical protein
VVAVVVFIALLRVRLSLGAVAVVEAQLLEPLEVLVGVLFMVVVVVEVVVELLLAIHPEVEALVAELKYIPLVVEEPLGLLVDQGVLAHNHHLVRALVVEAEPLQLLPMLGVAALAVLVEAVAVAVAHHKTVLVILAQVVLVALV